MTDPNPDIPTARIEPTPQPRWVWWIPLLAAIAACVLIGVYVVKRGPVVTVAMSHGYGLKAGDVVRARGIVVGQVERVRMNPEFDGVEATVRLEPESKELARAGGRWWVVRPSVTLGGVGGLETIAGPRYLSVIPGRGEVRSRFVALDEPPVIESMEPGGRELVLVADKRGSLSVGAPVMYRQVVIGTVLSVGLSGDAGSVEARAYIRPGYTNLIRDNSRFWNASGVGMEATFKGFRFDLESLQSLIEGGVSVATPDEPGKAVHTGHRFTLAAKSEDAWLAWRPAMAVGADLLPPGSPRPDMQRVAVSRQAGRFFKSMVQVTGWALPTADGLLGPTDLLAVSDESPRLEVAGHSFELSKEAADPRGPLTLLRVGVKSARTWPADRIRIMEKAEDCLISADPSAPPVPLPAGRLEKTASGWAVEPAVSFDPSLHGAAVLSQADGKLVGLLLVTDGIGVVTAVVAPK